MSGSKKGYPDSLSKTVNSEQAGNGPVHSAPADRVLSDLGADPEKGLTADDASKRLRRDGPNKIVSAAGTRWWTMLLGQFRSIVIWLLAFAAAVSWLTGNPLEAAAIVVVLVINALIGFAIEWQAGVALDALRKRSRARARVLRNGRETVIAAEELVRGDIVSLAAGDKVPADARVFESFHLETNESTLTGESLPVGKSTEPVAPDRPLAERSPMVYLGSTVTSGYAKAVVTATGAFTELGRVGSLISEASDERTPLEIRLSRLGERLVYIVLAIAAVVLAAGYLRGDGIWMMLEVSISLAVAAVPEGLPAVTTLILALGVLKMARRRAIVRKLAAVETLGSTTVICTDKTGTLTENRISVREFHCADGSVVSVADSGSLSDTQLRIVRAGVLCNDASIDSIDDEAASELGDPTETALLAAADRLGVPPAALRSGARLVEEMPFDPASKRMTASWEIEDGTVRAFLKGAPAVVLDACEEYLSEGGEIRKMKEETRERFLELNRDLAGRAFRVLAFADKDLQNGNLDDPDSGFVFLGFSAMSDPLRSEAADAVAAARGAGIRIIMLTGDQLKTAAAIANELGLASREDAAVHASELARAGSSGMMPLLKRAEVFARVSPEDKFRIVKALQDAGEVVAVTGDGVNDAPAMKQANIGVAMGMRGTEVAKESADIVLTDDNFATIVNAIESGRTIYSNILRFVHMMFSHNLGEVLLIFIAILAGLPLPLLPLQILWVNLVTDVFPALALAVEPPTENVMKRPPRPPGTRMLSRGFLTLVGWQGTMLGVISLAAYLWALGVYGEGEHARTIALLALIGVQLGHFFNCRSRIRSVFNRPFSNPWIFAAAGAVVALQAVAVFWQPLAGVLGVTTPTAGDLPVLAAAIALPVLIVEITKAVARYRLRTA
ncbi:MAG: cation-transporting P-type ATPase [Aridibacter famidurans]|nr:cation-transporting P-type ATPase [Aridibacter famidurans]